MFKVTKPVAGRVDIRLSGRLTSEDMRDGLDHLIALSQDVSRGRMLYEITDFALPSIGAVVAEMGRLPELFGLLGKFDKCAVVTDTGWLRTAAEIEGKVIPGLEIKSFAQVERDAAEEWLAV